MNQCDRCGGGLDGYHATFCNACVYELRTRRSFEYDVDHDTLVQWVWTNIVHGKWSRVRYPSPRSFQ